MEDLMTPDRADTILGGYREGSRLLFPQRVRSKRRYYYFRARWRPFHPEIEAKKCFRTCLLGKRKMGKPRKQFRGGREAEVARMEVTCLISRSSPGQEKHCCFGVEPYLLNLHLQLLLRSQGRRMYRMNG